MRKENLLKVLKIVNILSLSLNFVYGDLSLLKLKTDRLIVLIL